VLDILVQDRRDTAAARGFLRRLLTVRMWLVVLLVSLTHLLTVPDGGMRAPVRGLAALSGPGSFGGGACRGRPKPVLQ
jgi:hypothetical protein